MLLIGIAFPSNAEKHPVFLFRNVFVIFVLIWYLPGFCGSLHTIFLRQLVAIALASAIAISCIALSESLNQWIKWLVRILSTPLLAPIQESFIFKPNKWRVQYINNCFGERPLCRSLTSWNMPLIRTPTIFSFWAFIMFWLIHCTGVVV